MKSKPTFADLLLSFPASSDDIPARNKSQGRDFDWSDEKATPDGSEGKPKPPVDQEPSS